eukprot:374576_1
MSGKMNPEKLKKLQGAVRTGGPGSVRRKKKVVRSNGGSDVKKIAETLKRSGVNPLPGCEEAKLHRDDGTVIHFTNPKIQANVNANTYYISGKAEERKEDVAANVGDNDEVPDLVPVFDKE